MNWLESITGLFVILLAVGGVVFFSLPQQTRTRLVLRPIRAMRRLRRATGLAVEDGSRLHVSIGSASIISLNNASALVGLSTLERVGSLSSVSDRPPVATSGDGTLAILTQDTLHDAYRTANVAEFFDPSQARLTGVTPFSYAAGTLPIIEDERVSTNILIGNFGPEIALLTEAAERKDAFTLAASDSIAAQAVLYATAREPLIGEELFAVPAYMQGNKVHQASVRTQDVLRWVIIAVLVGGAVLSVLGVIP